MFEKVVNNQKLNSDIFYPLEIVHSMTFQQDGPLIEVEGHGEKVIVYTDDGIKNVDIPTRSIIWELEEDIYMSRFIDSGLLYGLTDDGLCCLDSNNGSKIWIASPQVEEYPIAHTNNCLICVDQEATPPPISCRSKENGEIIWKYDNKYPLLGNVVVYENLGACPRIAQASFHVELEAWKL